jgi:DNA-binding CsgD family transcriptional regulator
LTTNRGRNHTPTRPIIDPQSILGRIIEERGMGMICLAPDGRCVETNERARELVHDYVHSADIEAGPGAFSRFAAHALATRNGLTPWRLQHRYAPRQLDVTIHALAKEHHALLEDVWLLMLEETRSFPVEHILRHAVLTPRQLEIAEKLATTGLSYKAIATRLGIEYNTMRTHAENIYRHMNVHSRSELVERWRNIVSLRKNLTKPARSLPRSSHRERSR